MFSYQHLAMACASTLVMLLLVMKKSPTDLRRSLQVGLGETHRNLLHHKDDTLKLMTSARIFNSPAPVMSPSDASCNEVKFENTVILEFVGNSSAVAGTLELAYLENVFSSAYNTIIFCDGKSMRVVDSVTLKQQASETSRQLQPLTFSQTYRAIVRGRCAGCQGELSTLFDARNLTSPKNKTSKCPDCPGPTAADFAFYYETILIEQGGLVTIQAVSSATELAASQPTATTTPTMPPSKIPKMLPVNGPTMSHVDEPTMPPIKEPKRFNSIQMAIQMSGITSQEDLRNTNTAQYLALVWLSDYDSAKLLPNDAAVVHRYALAVFYFSTFPNIDIMNIAARENYGVWTNNGLWLSGSGYCDWYGVACETRLEGGNVVSQYNENGVIIGLNLPNNHLRGTIPSELCALANLQILDLGKNALTGTLPLPIMSIASIKLLYLDDNGISGTIPTEIGNLNSIRDVRFGKNKLAGSIPMQIGALSLLQSLGLEENSLTGPIPSLSNLTELLVLKLNDNYLTGTIYSTMSTHKDLHILHLGGNYLTGSIPDTISNMTYLESFHVHDNVLTGSIPDVWASIPRLQEIQTQSNYLIGTLPSSIHNLRLLQVLLVNDNRLDGTLPFQFGNLSYLQRFVAYDNSFEGSIPTEYGQMKELNELRLSNNKLTGVIPSELGNLIHLEQLDLQNNTFKGLIPSKLGQLDFLENCSLNGNMLTGTVPEELCALKKANLTYISTDCNKKEGGIVCSCCDECFPVKPEQ